MIRLFAKKLPIQKVVTNHIKPSYEHYMINSAKLLTFFSSNKNYPKVAINFKENQWLNIVEYAHSEALSFEPLEFDQIENRNTIIQHK
jgi:hypothetical protein